MIKSVFKNIELLPILNLRTGTLPEDKKREHEEPEEDMKIDQMSGEPEVDAPKGSSMQIQKELDMRS